MCWIEYYPVIPEGCYAKKKHIALNKRLSPCSAVFAAAFFKQIKQETSAQTAEEHLNLSMYKMFLARVNTSSHDGVFPPSAPVYKFCPPEECKIVESYHRELGTARLRAADPSCPVCKGEMGKYDALMIKGPIHYAILPNGQILKEPGMPDDLPASLCLRVHRIAPSFVEDKKRLHPKGGMLKLSGYEKEQTTTTIGKETMHLIQPFIMPVFKPVFKRVTQRKPRIAISNMKAEETIYC